HGPQVRASVLEAGRRRGSEAVSRPSRTDRSCAAGFDAIKSGRKGNSGRIAAAPARHQGGRHNCVRPRNCCRIAWQPGRLVFYEESLAVADLIRNHLRIALLIGANFWITAGLPSIPATKENPGACDGAGEAARLSVAGRKGNARAFGRTRVELVLARPSGA